MGRHDGRWLAPALLLLLAATLAPAVAAETVGRIVFDFETGGLQGWQVVEGGFDRLVCDRATFHNAPKTPYNKQGRFFLTTLERADGRPDDSLTGVVESPVFILAPGPITFRVGGGAREATYVALCDEAGRELRRATGADTEVMQTVTWDAAPWVGRRVLLRVVDRHAGGWGHVTFDDFQASGRVDAEATRSRQAARERERAERVRAEALRALQAEIASLRAAILDLSRTFGPRYPRGAEFLKRLDALSEQVQARAEPAALPNLQSSLAALRRESLLANPLVSGQPLVYVVRPQYRADHHSTATLFQTGAINTASFQGGGALKVIDLARGETRTLVAVPEGIVRDPEVGFDGRRVLFSMRRNRDDDYHVYEVNAEGTGLRQITTGSGHSDVDPAYLPDGGIAFASTREPKVCHCNRHVQANLWRMDADGGTLRQIGRNTLFEGHPALLPDGRILYDRWEYVDKHFGPAFGLWTMNPDGTNHALYYGNNAWSPGAMLDARPVPGTHWVIATFASCHDRPWGALALADPARGFQGTEPLLRAWPADIARYLPDRRDYDARRTRGHPMGGQIDTFKPLQPKYEDPYPLSERYFLCARTIEGERTGLFLLDVFGNEVLLHAEGPGCYDPMPLAPRLRPPAIPPRVDPAQPEGLFYVMDVYRGSGMERVPRGTVKTLRVVEAPVKVAWSRRAWNIDATQAPAMNWNCTNSKRILGDVPVAPDGSAYFRVPAGKFIFFQLLDENGMMIQSMRSGATVQPGERAGCVGCHESRRETAPNQRAPQALRRPASALKPWYGPARDFDYRAEVQPVFDRHCVSCHDDGKPAGAVLNLAGDVGLVFNTSYLELRRRSAVRWFPDAPDAPKLLVKAADDGPPEALPPFAWGSHRSRLVDVIRGEHHGVRLDREGVDRIVTWVDMNAPFYGGYDTPWGDNAFGRSPLDDRQLARLSQLAGVPLGTEESEMQGAQVSFTRPELSPCLAGLKDRDPGAYAEALGIIRAGQAARRVATQEGAR